MASTACALVFVMLWLAMAGYMNYKIWRRPDEIWQRQQDNLRPSGGPSWMRRWLHIDPLGLEKSRGRFIWFERFIAGLLLLLGVAMLVGVIAEAAK